MCNIKIFHTISRGAAKWRTNQDLRWSIISRAQIIVPKLIKRKNRGINTINRRIGIYYLGKKFRPFALAEARLVFSIGSLEIVQVFPLLAIFFIDALFFSLFTAFFHSFFLFAVAQMISLCGCSSIEHPNESTQKTHWSVQRVFAAIEWWRRVMDADNEMPFILPNHFKSYLFSCCRWFLCISSLRTQLKMDNNKTHKDFPLSIFMKTNWHASIISWLLHSKNEPLSHRKRDRSRETVIQISKFSISNINLFV